MIHYMKLVPQAFYAIACGYKTIELRLNDEKRQMLRCGDEIVFSNNSAPELTLKTKVIALHHFPSFVELYKSLPLDKCGYLPMELASASPEDMSSYYSVEQQGKYGVVGIEIEL